MIRLAPGVRDGLVAHAREGAPAEVCGVLGGRWEDGDAHVTEHRRVANVADAPRTRYELDPAEQVAAIDAIEQAGNEVVGFYHSHPRGPDEPSATDERLATWPGKVYAIVSLAGEPAVRAWRWTGDAFERERVVE